MRNYILDSIDSENYNTETSTDFEKLMFLYRTLKTEYLTPYNLKRYGSERNCFREWIAGLPSSFNIAFDCCEIIEIGERLKLDRHEGPLCDEWFDIITSEVFKLFSYYNIRALSKAKFKIGQPVTWSHIKGNFKIKKVFYDCGIRYSLENGEGMEFGGREFEYELTAI